LAEVKEFGSNPGDLRMLTFAPAKLRCGSPLVLVLHGCGQTAGDIDRGAGWSKLANDRGFALLAPEQKPSNNAKRGFNWFRSHDNRRGAGEALSIRQMVAWMIDEHRLDRRRVYITGLSAGGAMTSVMLAAYPEVFAGGAIIAGLPFGAATNVLSALALMKGRLNRTSQELGDRIRAASGHDGLWPRISIWQGSADPVVAVSNAGAIARQWCDVHGLREEDAIEKLVAGQTRRFWRGPRGRAVIETFTIPGMGHAVPLDLRGKRGRVYGEEGRFFKDVGISSAVQIARFWDLG
jgi:poly(hydroxyalkanoate) depolymerase family esterase